ncbi:hypothetical protein GGI11_005242 [Coemansia sp. RSA 2049]|nr:hypothetical protein GGI11_005242 [Coemansia sp. RSA 2049]
MFCLKRGHRILATGGSALQPRLLRRSSSTSIGGIETVELVYNKEINRKEAGKKTAGAKKTPLVVLHGLFGSKQNWGGITRRLAQELERDVYAVDQRNHGESRHLGPHTYQAMAADLVRFIEDHRLGSPVLMGHSMGGKVVMRTALERPDLVSRLIVVDMVPAAATLHHNFQGYVECLKDIEKKNLSVQAEMDKILATIEPSLEIRQFLLTNMKKTTDPGNPESRGVYRSRIPLDLVGSSLGSMMQWDTTAHSAGVAESERPVYNGPTLFIAGTQSPYVKPDAYPEMRRLFPNHEIAELNTGHWVHAEKPRQFMDLVVKFIQESN